MRSAAALLVLGLGLALAQDSSNNGGNNGGYNFGDNNGGKNGNGNLGAGGNGNANGNRNTGNGNGNGAGNNNNGAGNGVFNGNFNNGNGNGNGGGNNNLGDNNGIFNGNSNNGNGNGGKNGNGNTGSNNGGYNGNFNFGDNNGRNNGNGNVGSNNGNGNGNNNGAKGQGDPIFTDFVGRSFEFLGEPGRYYNILSEQHHTLSTLMKVGVMWDHNGTYMEGFGFQYRGHTVVTSISADEQLIVSIDGQQLLISEDETERDDEIDAGAGHTLSISWQRSKAEYGQTAEIATEMMKLTVWLTEAGTKDEGGVLQPAYLNFDLSLLSSPAGNVMAGVVGETFERLVAGAEEVAQPTHALYLPDDSTFRGHALAEDYEQQGFFDAQHRFNLYGGAAIVHARRLASAGAVTFPASAAGRGAVKAAKGAAPKGVFPLKAHAGGIKAIVPTARRQLRE